jgi:hypothetical protein
MDGGRKWMIGRESRGVWRKRSTAELHGRVQARSGRSEEQLNLDGGTICEHINNLMYNQLRCDMNVMRTKIFARSSIRHENGTSLNYR